MGLFKIEKNHVLSTWLRGHLVLQTPILNKGTAFTEEERRELGLKGLLPPHQKTIDEQVNHLYSEFKNKRTNLDKHIFLRWVQDENETLFYRLLRQHIGEMLEIVYTPTVGEACQHFNEIYRRPRGLFISYPDRDRIDEILDNAPTMDVRAIVVTDGGRILGLGDQGVGGMGIPIGKMSLYTVCGGLNPAYALPVVLDVGTNNEAQRNNPFYLGWRHERLTGKDYEDFVDRVVKAIKKKFPNVLLQWEDFAKEHAHLFLDRYQDQLCTFNDDIQGTAAISTTAILSGVRILKQSIKDQRVVILGAGSAGTGIAAQIVNAMIREGSNKEEAEKKIWLIDRNGLIMENQPGLASFQKPFAKASADVATWKVANPSQISFFETISNLSPTVLIGVSSATGAFTEEIVKEMAKHTEYPIILPLSNPDSRAEAKPEDLIRWTNGKAIVATGTKFPDVSFQGKTIQIGQCNNHYIFPSMGLGILASGAKRVSDSMFLAAALKLSEFSPALKDRNASLFPSPDKIPEISKEIAVAVGMQAQMEGLASKTTLEEMKRKVEESFWEPNYWNVKFTGNK